MGRELERRLPKGGLIKATSFTHTSVHAHDLDESVRFYKELFGMEEIPAPDFPFPVRWLRLGDLQLHLFQSEDLAPKGHHFGVDVDDFEATYVKVGKMDVREKEGYFSYLYEIPDGAVQMYLRDPAGNMVEVNWPDVSTLDRSVVTEEIHKIEAETAESAKATLYL
jgi:catechol 2,3-dioxygenase-like lactoylglutathione lyase family enzyme